MAQILLLVAIFAVGVVILYYGAEGMLHGAVSIATRMGVSQLVIGLTLVAFGTSVPELAVNLRAMYLGQPHLALGNAVGSNIVNLGLTLGVAALVAPLLLRARMLVPLLVHQLAQHLLSLLLVLAQAEEQDLQA